MPDLLMPMAFLLAVLGFALLALSQTRHAHHVQPTQALSESTRRWRRRLGGVGLSLSLPVCIASQGAGMGSLLWGVSISTAAITVAFILTWRPRWLRPLAGAGRAP